MTTLKTCYTDGSVETTTYPSMFDAVMAAQYRTTWKCVKVVSITPK